MDRTHDEIRLALDAYHRELAKLNHSALQGGALPPGLLGLPPHHPGMPPHNGVSPQDLSLPKPERPASAAKHSPHHSSSSSSHNGPLSDVDDKAAVAKEISDAAAVADALRHAGSAFSLVRPKTEPGELPMIFVNVFRSVTKSLHLWFIMRYLPRKKIILFSKFRKLQS
jgi:homeobox protein cut-like